MVNLYRLADFIAMWPEWMWRKSHSYYYRDDEIRNTEFIYLIIIMPASIMLSPLAGLCYLLGIIKM